MSSIIILTIGIIVFVVVSGIIAYDFIKGEIDQEKRIAALPKMKHETPKERRARLESKYK